MNSRIHIVFWLGMLAAAIGGPRIAQASLSMDTLVRSIYQIGDGSTAVSLGHTVVAGTNLNRLTAGGTFNASCISQYTGVISGERTLSSNLNGQYNQLYVTIPEQLPAVRNMPGFENVLAGSILQCTYRWTAQAREPTYTVGIPGFSITVGGEELSNGSSISFEMYKSGSGELNNGGCMH